MDLYENIKKIASEKNYSINKLEKECDLPRSSIAKFRTSSPSIDKIITIADKLNCSVDYILSGVKPEIPDIDENSLRLLEMYAKLNKEQQNVIVNTIKQFLAL